MKPYILCIDDDADILHIVKMAIELTGTADVGCAIGGLKGLESVRMRKPDIILLDVMMPELNGFDVVTTVKNDPALADIPVIFLSARNQQDDVQKFFAVGAAAYIEKPFDPMQLPTLIARACPQIFGG